MQVLEDFIFNSHVIILLSGQFCLIFMLLFIVLSVGLTFFISVLPFSCFLPPLVCFFIAPSETLCFLNGKFISVDGYERVPVFALCTEKNNAGRLHCPQHFLSSKTFLNPSFLLVVCRKKRLINSDGAIAANSYRTIS